eukprot:NODE_67_length_25542_cov_1.476831.p16 type:complete len:216 gc:universal NODE_67_length_25542_cov_1.476831:18322-17675(-)
MLSIMSKLHLFLLKELIIQTNQFNKIILFRILRAKMSDLPNLGSYEGARNEKYEREGQGKAIYTNGDIYDGNFAAGKRDGFGIYQYFNQSVGKTGAIYEGEYKNGKKHGKGKMTYFDGSIYEGEWFDNERQGQGTFTYTNQDYYKGGYFQSKKQGVGEYFSFETKLLVKGLWNEGVIQGSVRILREDGEVEGEFENNRMLKYKFLEIAGQRVLVE